MSASSLDAYVTKDDIQNKFEIENLDKKSSGIEQNTELTNASQAKEQEGQQTIKINLTERFFSNDSNKSIREVSFNEIQNFLDETIEIIDSNNSIKDDENITNYVADTDPEDETEDTHLDMSISLINYSFYSTKSTFFIPEKTNDSDIIKKKNETKKDELVFSDSNMKEDENVEGKSTDMNLKILTENIENEYATITDYAEKLETKLRFSTNELIFTQKNLNIRKDEEIIIESTLWPDENEYLDSLEISSFSLSELSIDKDCRLNVETQSTELLDRDCKQSPMRKNSKSFEADSKLKSSKTSKHPTNNYSTEAYSEINDLIEQSQHKFSLNKNSNAAGELNINRRSSLRIQCHIVSSTNLTKEKLHTKKENSNLPAQKSSKRRKPLENNKCLISTDTRKENKEKFKSNKLKKNFKVKSRIEDKDEDEKNLKPVEDDLFNKTSTYTFNDIETSKYEESADENNSKKEKSLKNRGLKRKSTDFELRTNNLEERSLSNPSKIFFHSKKRTISGNDQWNSLSANSLNQPRYAPAMSYLSNKSTTDSIFSSKKFKLHSKSASSLDLKSQDTSDTNQALKSPNLDNFERSANQETDKIISNETNDCKVTTNELSDSNFLISTNKKPTRLNNTVKLEKSAPKEPIKNRCSLQINSTGQSSSSRALTSRSLKGNNVPKIMSTGILLSEKQKKIVTELGGQIVTDVNDCTHLITNKIRRTYKFLSCLNRSTFILNERWLDECKKNKMFSNTDIYALKDDIFEKKHKFTLQISLSRSKSNKLFRDWKFLINCSDSDPEMTVDNIKTIINCGNGEILAELPKEADKLNRTCIVYDDEESLKSDKNYGQTTANKVLLHELLNSILKQSFNYSNMCQTV